jgi:hypothetical protein
MPERTVVSYCSQDHPSATGASYNCRYVLRMYAVGIYDVYANGQTAEIRRDIHHLSCPSTDKRRSLEISIYN